MADIFRLVFILMVIAIHAGVFFGNPLLSFYTVDGFFRVAVPIFFIINGFYFQKNVTDSFKFRKWLTRVVLLFVSWQVIYLPLYLPLHDINSNHLAVFFSELIFGYHHLWYIAAMASGGVGLYFLRNQSRIIFICVGLFFAGALLQYSRVFIKPDSLYYKVFSQYWIFRNGLFFGFPMMYIGSYLARHNIIQKISVDKINLLFILGGILLTAELTFVYICVFKGDSYHIDFILSLLLLCPVIFILLMKDTRVYFKGFNTKNLALICSAMYFTHPYVINFLTASESLPNNEVFMLTIVITFFLSLLLFLFRKWLYFLF
ncbi:acyltransferase family protein [Rahnella ecdela]|uniref:Acyltransferase family protein n=1 Tax=Rahnella ecdela TaxID=2816250 RepID=A0ABS6LNA5_9GAMM|nr:acyltransferase family protein [Rahnella ecdela]MBU9848315.1 acyltransferase family protein [Rahnella ecdela]